VVAAASVIAALFAVRKRPAIAAGGLAFLFAGSAFVAFWHSSPSLEAGKLELTAIDVGQGDALLLVSPNGQTMLVDAGGSTGRARSEFDYGEDVVSPYLWSRGLERLDVVLLTHAHGDHIGGLARVIHNFRPRELWVGINATTEATVRMEQSAADVGAQLRHHTASEEFPWAGARIHVLSPPADWQSTPRHINDDSLSFVISYGATRALLAGDLETRMERFISWDTPRVDVLKVAHHGSRTSTTPELLRAAQPRFALISAGYRNWFHHPNPEVLARLQAAHVRTFRTDMLGTVTFLLDGKNVEVRAGLPSYP
jgi:competence protein ComEC